jgi:hypothetical protein
MSRPKLLAIGDRVILGRRPTGMWSTLLCVAFPLVYGCDNTAALPSHDVALKRFVTGNAANHLHGGDTFSFDIVAAGADPEITMSQAELLAQAWSSTYAALLRHYLETGHGGPIAVDRLVPCGRPLYAKSSFEPLDASIDAGFRRAIAPWWLVGLCQNGQIAVSLAVSALATDLTITGGRIQFPLTGAGNEFFPMGVPSSWEGPVPTSPEDAVTQAARATGLRATEVPELIAPAPHFGPPQRAAWRIVLEAPASMHGSRSGRTVAASIVFHGPVRSANRSRPTAAIVIPTADQPSPTRGVLTGPGGRTVILSVRAGVPLQFEPATRVSGGP